MITLMFRSEMDLFHFMVVTETYSNLIDFEQLSMRGELTEAELELAFKAFNADVAGLEQYASQSQLSYIRSVDNLTELSIV